MQQLQSVQVIPDNPHGSSVCQDTQIKINTLSMASPQATSCSQIPWPLGTCCYRSLKEAQGYSSTQLAIEHSPCIS